MSEFPVFDAVAKEMRAAGADWMTAPGACTKYDVSAWVGRSDEPANARKTLQLFEQTRGMPERLVSPVWAEFRHGDFRIAVRFVIPNQRFVNAVERPDGKPAVDPNAAYVLAQQFVVEPGVEGVAVPDGVLLGFRRDKPPLVRTVREEGDDSPRPGDDLANLLTLLVVTTAAALATPADAGVFAETGEDTFEATPGGWEAAVASPPSAYDYSPAAEEFPTLVNWYNRFVSPRAKLLERIDRGGGFVRPPALVAGDPKNVWFSWEKFRSAGGDPGVTARAEEAVRKALAVPGFGTCGLYPLSRLVGGGPKIVQMTADECEALAQADARIPWGEYRQPFSTLAVALPPEFGATNLVRADQPVPARPIGVIIDHRPDDWGDVLYATVVLATGVLVTWVAPRVKGSEEIEESLVAEMTAAGSSRADGPTLRLIRLAVNAAHLLATTGANKLGPYNPEHAARLRERLKKKAPPAARAANEFELRTMPVVYSFVQELKIAETADVPPPPPADGESDAVRPSGYTVKPHFRRGHWAKIRHGPRHENVYRRWRHHVFVNSRFFGGDMGDARTVIIR